MINKESRERQKAVRKKVEGRQERQKGKVEDMQRKTEEKDRKQKTGKVEHRKRKRLKRIGSEKTKMEKYVSFREQIATKERRKKTTEVRSARYICAGEISSRDPSEGSQGSQKEVKSFQ